jgi:hypothetical protein
MKKSKLESLCQAPYEGHEVKVPRQRGTLAIKPKVKKIIVDPVLIGLKPGQGKIGVKIETRIAPEKWPMIPVRYLKLNIHLGDRMVVEIPIEAVEDVKHGERRS